MFVHYNPVSQYCTKHGGHATVPVTAPYVQSHSVLCYTPHHQHQTLRANHWNFEHVLHEYWITVYGDDDIVILSSSGPGQSESQSPQSNLKKGPELKLWSKSNQHQHPPTFYSYENGYFPSISDPPTEEKIDIAYVLCLLSSYLLLPRQHKLYLSLCLTLRQLYLVFFCNFVNKCP